MLYTSSGTRQVIERQVAQVQSGTPAFVDDRDRSVALRGAWSQMRVNAESRQERLSS